MKTGLIKKYGIFIILALIATLMATMVIGCGSNEVAPKVEEPKPTTINISGSTSVQPFSEILSQNYMAKNPGVKIFVQGGGSSAGIKAAQEGASDIGASSRDLKTEEKNLVETVIAKDGIAVVVHPTNKVTNLTTAQIKDIYAGTITNWKEVGGLDQAIDVVTREEGSGTRGAFEELVMGKDAKIKTGAIVQNSTGAVRTTVAGDPKGIGFVSLASLNDSVKAVTVEGVAGNSGNVLNGTYKLSRPFIFLTKAEPTGEVKKFIDYILTAEGQALLEKEGLIKVK
jgi:phosphate transport system substrate-binding protein